MHHGDTKPSPQRLWGARSPCFWALELLGILRWVGSGVKAIRRASGSITLWPAGCRKQGQKDKASEIFSLDFAQRKRSRIQLLLPVSALGRWDVEDLLLGFGQLRSSSRSSGPRRGCKRRWRWQTGCGARHPPMVRERGSQHKRSFRAHLKTEGISLFSTW